MDFLVKLKNRTFIHNQNDPSKLRITHLLVVSQVLIVHLLIRFALITDPPFMNARKESKRFGTLSANKHQGVAFEVRTS